MATIPTDKPVGSNDVKDLLFNSEKLDEVVNSESLTYVDRKSNERLTIKGLEEAAVSAGPTVEAAAKALEILSSANDNVIGTKKTAAESAAAAVRAEKAASQAEALINIEGVYPDTAAGQAATAEGGYFCVPNPPGYNYYRNVSGIATFVMTVMPSSSALQSDGSDILQVITPDGLVTLIQRANGDLFLPRMSQSVQDAIAGAKATADGVSAKVSTSDLPALFALEDDNGDVIWLVDASGAMWLPGMSQSVQEAIGAGPQPEVSLDQSGGAAVYADLTPGSRAISYQWSLDGQAINGARGVVYIPQVTDAGGVLSCAVKNLVPDFNPTGSMTGYIGGVALESEGAEGSLYEGYTLSAGDDFNTLDILTPANPRGKWITTRTYLNPPRGSDTLLGTMYDTDPAFTGFNDSNRGIPVGFNNMRVDGGILRLQARAATSWEKSHTQGNRHDLAAMVSSAAAFSFYAGPEGTGDCIIEWFAMFTHKTQNPAGWHPSLWTQSSLPSYTYNSDEHDIVEGTSQFATSNYNIWGANGSRTGGGSLGPEKDIFDGQFHKITAILNHTQVKIYIDDVLSSTASIDANAVQEPGYLLMSSHVYNGTFHREAYSALAWEQLWRGATISVDWCRVWRRTGRSHIKPRVDIPSVNIAYGQGGELVLPGKIELWGRDDILEHVQVVMVEENEPGGSHTVPYNSLPPFVTYDSTSRTISIGNSYTKAGRLNFVIYGYLQDGSSCEPARAWVNIGPNFTRNSITLAVGQSLDLYPLWDCGVLVSDGVRCTKIVGVYGLPQGVVFDTASCQLINFGAAASTYNVYTSCRNSEGQHASKSIQLIIG